MENENGTALELIDMTPYELQGEFNQVVYDDEFYIHGYDVTNRLKSIIRVARLQHAAAVDLAREGAATNIEVDDWLMTIEGMQQVLQPGKPGCTVIG